jgi:pyruvate dehydrogenase E1 component beta subunit
MAEEQMNFRKSIPAAIAAEMRLDPNIILLGEDVGAAGGVFKTSLGLFDEFGPQRVLDTPISEQAIIGAAIGSSIQGLRPIAELMFADFAGVTFDQIANQLAKYRYMSAGQYKLPVTVRLANGVGGGFAAQHSQSAENWFLNIPGLKIVTPATPNDMYGLLRSAIVDDNPVLVFEHKGLFNVKGDISNERIPLGVAQVVTRGTDLTIVATQLMRHRAVEAAEILNSRGISVEVIDPRTLVPFDDATIRESLSKTSRLLVVQEGPAGGSWGSDLIARTMSDSWSLFDAPPRLISSPSTPVPYAANLENAWLPSVDKIVHAATELTGY